MLILNVHSDSETEAVEVYKLSNVDSVVFSCYLFIIHSDLLISESLETSLLEFVR